MDFFNQSVATPILSLLSTTDIEFPNYYKYTLAWLSVALVSAAVQYSRARKRTIHVPAECSSVLWSYLGAYDFLSNAKTILNEGYKKYGRGTFKVPGLERWTVIINKSELVEEIRKAPDDKISFTQAIGELIAAPWTVGSHTIENHYHLEIIRSQLTRCLTSRFSDVSDEIAHAFEDLVGTKGDEWIAVPALRVVRSVVCRTSNRIFIGLPLCRDPDYIDLNVQFAVSVAETALKINKFPVFLRPIVGALLSSTPRSIRRGMKHLAPLIENRIRQYDEHGGEWSDKPADMLSWLMDEAPEDEKRSVYKLTTRMLLVNFAAIHTSANSFTHALFHLASEPEYIAPLREEVERVIAQDGWSKIAMTKMWKLDSFLKESQRLNGINMLSLNRKVLVDYTLSDGTFLPAGTFIACNADATHRDEAHYAHAAKFDGFRFAEMREGGADEGTKHQMVATGADYLSFGHGRHACPGRFFAVNELKAMMAHLLLTYDVKLEVEGVRPESVYLGTRLTPNPTANVLFRKRTKC
ncbi:hypothetical protein M0805_003613 [Coniferiporia weirii]|nr:hypothetical protein M0805_003613 [Coniferiporia weirii]